MDPIRHTLLAFYQAVTARSRLRAVRRLAIAGRAPVAILFYHRVADTHPNGWTLPLRRFRRQIDWLAERFDIVSLAEAQRRLEHGSNPRPAVAITFDDGYGENSETAIPWLLERRLPFTYFVSTQIVRDQSAFPHDLKAGVRLRPNTITELRAMADAGVELGAHTRTHADLGSVTHSDRLRDEIVGSMDDLESWTGRRPRAFAFPFGLPTNMTPVAFEIARAAGIEAICSAYGAYNFPERVSDDLGPLHLRRVHADPEWVRFTNWMTFDARKLQAADPIVDEEYLEALLSRERNARAAAPLAAEGFRA